MVVLSPVTAVMIGAGERGLNAYAPYALEHPERLRFVAVAEPNPIRRERFAAAHGIPPERRFDSWQELLARGQMAEVAFDMTQDRMHCASATAAMEAGYHVLLEKPMATTVADCVRLVQTAERTGRLLLICHVLRYTNFFARLHEIIGSGRLGEIATVEHRENITYWHMAHSYVRGNWRNLAVASPMILAKCCHDLDILIWNLGSPVVRLQSFGSLTHFRPEKAPAGATARCTDGCPAATGCPFDARRIYLDPARTEWPVTVISEDIGMEARRHALETGPYGRCVYRSDNDVVDHQTVSLELANGITAVLFMHGLSHEDCRTMRYDGSRATLRGKFGGEGTGIEIHDHVTGRREDVEIPPATSGHGGGDGGVVGTLIRVLRNEVDPLTTARASLESHLLAFAAEESRLAATVVEMGEYRGRVERARP